eukprot:s3575_g7.t1
MAVTKVAGDGDCLFHALAFFDGSDGGALRIDVADFMEAQAHTQTGFEVEWLREAKRLREGVWGGHTVIIAYSLMKQRRITVHTYRADQGAISVEEVSHGTVIDNDAKTMVHILYNSTDHYDALVELTDLSGMVPAWPQPPPIYFTEARNEFPPLGANAPKSDRPGKNGFNVPRPPKKGKGKAKGNKAAKSEIEASVPAAPAAPQHDEEEEEGTNQPGLMDALLNIPVTDSSSHPHRQAVAAADAGRLWPNVFCAFKGCRWAESFGTEEQLKQHLEEEHKTELEAIAQHTLRGTAPDAVYSVYNQAIAQRCRRQAPIAGASLDRTALYSFAEATKGHKVEALICWCCGCIHPRVEEVEDKGPIKWYQPLQRSDSTGELLFVNQPLQVVQKLLGLEVYLNRYNAMQPNQQVKLTDHESFEDWRVALPDLEEGDCWCSEQHDDPKVLCEHCWLPICTDCFKHLSEAKLPPLAYANDMWTGYGLQRIYEQNVTVIALACASPCLTSMVLLSMESKHRREPRTAVFDEQAHMARHRYGARGNVITFPLPVEALLQQLTAHLERPDVDEGVPRSGKQLCEVFRVILQTNKAGKTSEEEVKTLIHQARVVVDLIMDMRRLGHPSFINLDEAKVQEKPAELPEDGVPPEVLRVIHEEMGNDDAAMDRQDQRDAQEAEKLALENLVAELKDDGIRTGLETYEVRAGNQLVDMFRPCYWAIAFCFLFKHATAEPDVVNTIKTEREGMEPSRRKKGNKLAPEVGIQAWAASMQRQAAAQFRRDWNFSPAVWNYLFRTRINQAPNAYMFMKLDEDGGGRRLMTTKEIQAPTQEVYRQLHFGTYLDTNNELNPVNGDLSKVAYVPGLSVGAHHVLNNLQARTRKVPGTHAVRSTMRHQTHANRICYGTVSLFVTFSPSEKDSAIAVRMARARQSDPAIAGDSNKSFYTRGKPELDVEFCRLSPERLAEAFGRALLARDPLACAYAFQVLVGLAFRHIFGLKFCPNCPDCACSDTPCMDAFGSSTTARGGVFGRIDAGYGSLECRRCGAYHLHGQFFLECFHQFRSLTELVDMGHEPLLELLRKYSIIQRM